MTKTEPKKLTKEETAKEYEAGKKAAERHAKTGGKPSPYLKGGR